MPRSKTATITDVEKIVESSFDELFSKLLKSVDKMYDKNANDLTQLKQYLIEIKTEMRMIRMLYVFWAEQNLSPEFIEKFTKEFETIELHRPKRVD